MKTIKDLKDFINQASEYLYTDIDSYNLNIYKFKEKYFPVVKTCEDDDFININPIHSIIYNKYDKYNTCKEELFFVYVDELREPIFADTIAKIVLFETEKELTLYGSQINEFEEKHLPNLIASKIIYEIDKEKIKGRLTNDFDKEFKVFNLSPNYVIHSDSCTINQFIMLDGEFYGFYSNCEFYSISDLFHFNSDEFLKNYTIKLLKITSKVDEFEMESFETHKEDTDWLGEVNV